METLEGNLNTSSYLQVLEHLTARNPACSLLTSDGKDEKVVYFSTGGVRLYASEGRRIASLPEFLLERGLVEREPLETALRALEDNRKEGLDEILERKGLLPRARLTEAISELILLELCDLATWETALYEFYEGNPPPQIFDPRHPAVFASLDVKTLCTNVKKWTEEWVVLKSKLYSERLRPRLLPNGRESLERRDLPAPVRKVYSRSDGEHGLRALCRLTGVRFPELARVVRDGLRDGHLRGAVMAEKEPTTTTEILEEIERLEEILDKAINTILIHKRIASGYEKLDDRDRASAHYQTIGDIHAGASRVQQALESYRKALAISPQNFSAHDALIRKLQEQGMEDAAQQEILELSKKLISFGLLDRALETLRVIAKKAGSLLEARLLYADLLMRMGRITEAVLEYLALAREKKKRGEGGLEEIYRRVLALDPANREARDGLSLEERRRVGKKVVWANRVCFAAGLLLLATAATGETLGFLAYHSARTTIAEATRKGDREGFKKLWDLGRRFSGGVATRFLLDAENTLFEEAFRLVEGLLSEARIQQKQGRLSEARKAYIAAANTAFSDGQRRRAREGLAEADVAVAKAKELRRQVELSVDARLYEDAFLLSRTLLESYSDVAAGVKVPYYFETDPPGARVDVQGTPRGTTPLWLTVSAGAEVKLVLQGYVTHVVEGLETRRSPTVNVTLKREPQREPQRR